MDLTRLLVVFLCAFASEVNGAHLATAISHRHPTGNASARSALEETTTKVAPKTISFSLNQYAQRLYDRINSHLNEVDQGVQFAFIMIVRSYELRFDFPQAMKDRMTGSDVSLPPLNKGGTYPADGNSNLVIAGLDRSKPMQGGGRDTPYHSEQQVIAKMPAMDNYYDHHYFENLENLICPWIIILGSKFDTCYNKNPKFGRCANKFIAEKNTYVEQTTCTSTTWVVYIDQVGLPDVWEQAVAAYNKNNIWAFANFFSAMPEANEKTQVKLKRSMSTNETFENSTLP